MQMLKLYLLSSIYHLLMAAILHHHFETCVLPAWVHAKSAHLARQLRQQSIRFTCTQHSIFERGVCYCEFCSYLKRKGICECLKHLV